MNNLVYFRANLVESMIVIVSWTIGGITFITFIFEAYPGWAYNSDGFLGFLGIT